MVRSATAATPPAADPWLLSPNVLDGLAPAVRGRLAGLAERRAFETGATVMAEGAPTPFLGIVLAGRVGLRLVVPERGPQTVVTVEPGELLGWSAVVPPYRASAEALALAPTTLEIVPAARLRDVLARDQELTAQLLPIVLACLSDRLASSWHQLLDLFGAGSGATVL